MTWISTLIVISLVICVWFSSQKEKEGRCKKYADGQRLKPNVIHDVSLAVEKIIPAVPYLDPFAANNIAAQTNKDISVKENGITCYCCEVRTRKTLGIEEISDFQERLGRELLYIAQNRESHFTPLIIESMKAFNTYVQIVVKERR